MTQERAFVVKLGEVAAVRFVQMTHIVAAGFPELYPGAKQTYEDILDCCITKEKQV